MVRVLFTVDTEMWCGGWDRLDERFPDAFKRYIYGPTPAGDCALPLTLKILGDHGLHGVFFTEPLFACRFGLAPLQEMVGLIVDAKQEVQLHLHPEWVDEARTPILADVRDKRRFMRDFTRSDQQTLLALGTRMLIEVGAGSITAFRAGSFGMGRDTLAAVASAGLPFDSSYNQGRIAVADNPVEGGYLMQPARVGGVIEYPMSVIRDGAKLRQLQLGACSYEELEATLRIAQKERWHSVVILSHNFELMNQRKDRTDPVVVRRFRRLCRFLDRHRDEFETSGFSGTGDHVASHQPQPPEPGQRGKAIRLVEQIVRRLYH